mmetsp:Transcript_17754/g.31941  ORF Transcript_17754/g.31941 Transcript_17754/m.31941 type:complete len:110 (+) Transcript_17754:8-337(+)
MSTSTSLVRLAELRIFGRCPHHPPQSSHLSTLGSNLPGVPLCWLNEEPKELRVSVPSRSAPCKRSPTVMADEGKADIKRKPSADIPLSTDVRLLLFKLPPRGLELRFDL